MQLVRAYYCTPNSTSRYGHHRHAANSEGKPLCELGFKKGFNQYYPSGWIHEQGEPTCPHCIRLIQREMVQGGAA